MSISHWACSPLLRVGTAELVMKHGGEPPPPLPPPPRGEQHELIKQQTTKQYIYRDFTED